MVPSRDQPNTHQQWILLRAGGWGCRNLCRFCDGCEHHQHRHQGEAKKGSFLPLHKAKASAQGDSNVTAAERGVTLREGCRKSRTNSQPFRSWRNLAEGDLQGKDLAIHGVELASRGESLLPEHSRKASDCRATWHCLLQFSSSLNCVVLVFLISPSDHLYFNSFRRLKKSNYTLGV